MGSSPKSARASDCAAGMARVAAARREKVAERQAQRTASAAAWAEAAEEEEEVEAAEEGKVDVGVCGAGGRAAPPSAAELAAARVSLRARPNSCAARSRWPAVMRAWAREAKAGAESGFSCGVEVGDSFWVLVGLVG